MHEVKVCALQGRKAITQLHMIAKL
ncbi:hypothetical protein FP2506_13904 [Fulvimarina pelagi HTCC2506]|uniref:Uncharacterized protein n=1 Tax=Fulvimarina pelagi HTCC2506 TaxID=314231 RepID=Q0G4E9_9HYPH|nr:hypothetical protein FP2506_13904 [Fulvimarina pelagi HTCC2506]